MSDAAAEKPIQPQFDNTDRLAEQQRRVVTISSTVTRRYPGSDFLAAASHESGVNIEELDEGWKEWANSQRKTFEDYRQLLIDEVIKSQVEPEEVEDYFNTLTSLAKQKRTIKNEDDLYGIQDILSLAKASESLEKAKLWLKCIHEWCSKFMDNVDEKKAEQRLAKFNNLLIGLSGHNTSPRPPTRSIEETSQLFQIFSETYGFMYSLPDTEMQHFLLKKTIGDSTYEENLLYNMNSMIVQLGLSTHDPIQTKYALELLKTNKHIPVDKLNIFIDAICRYGSKFGISEQKVKGFQEKLLPALLNNDSQVQILLRGGNIWSMGPENMGIGDFICHCYVTEITPQNLNDLLLSIREVPSTDFTRFEQNRLDALTLSSSFGALRDFIHDQKPGVSDVLQGMIDYYQTGNRIQLDLLLLKTGGYLTSEDRRAIILNKNNYEMEVEERINGEKKKVKAVDVLKRLVDNTKPVVDKPPTTSNQTLNEKMITLIKSRTTRGVSRVLLGDTYDYMNNLLIELINHGEVGMEPNMVTALAWLERQGFYVLQNMNYEDQISIIKKKWFHSILQFQELTASPNNYSQEEFDGFINQVTNSENYIDAFKLVAKKILINLNKLSRKYKAEGKNERIGALWSGNTAHELIGLSELKPASTEYGRKHREEKLKPESERFKGD